MFSKPVIKVENLGKCFQIYEHPRDRLKQMVFSRARRFLGLEDKQYFREFWALKDISFELNRGETLGIIGRNGSGKSTLLQMISGTLTPTTGTVEVNGRVAALLELGSGFNPDFTGKENIYMNAAVLGLTKQEIDERYDDIVEFADIGDFVNQPVKTYSSGMMVRLAFAVQAQVDPDVLIIDEALAVGDYIFQQKCFKRIRDLQDNGCTILLVSHDLYSILQHCTKGFVFSEGHFIGGGSAKDAVNLFKKLTTATSQTIETKKNNREVSVFGLNHSYELNPSAQSYGSGVAEIYDWALLDEAGNVVSSIKSEEPTEIVIRLRFFEQAENPIIGYFFTDVQGREIVGTNTYDAGIQLGAQTPGKSIDVSFKQILGLASGEYAINIGCSEFINGKLVSHHRLYDLYVFQVYRTHPNVGFYLPPTEITINFLS